MKLFQSIRYYKWRRQKKFQKKMETILKRKAFHKIRICDYHISKKQKRNMIIDENKRLMEEIFDELGQKVPLSIMMWIEDDDY
jgi:hypothetical protein